MQIQAWPGSVVNMWGRPWASTVPGTRQAWPGKVPDKENNCRVRSGTRREIASRIKGLKE